MPGKIAIFAMMVGGMITVEGGCASHNLRSELKGSSVREINIAPRLQTLTITFTLSPTLTVNESQGLPKP